MPDAAAPLSLTAAQLRVAHEHAANPGDDAARDDRSIFLYHEDEHTTKRWLVDPHGRVIEIVWVRR